MKIEVSDEFFEMLNHMTYEMQPDSILALLRWGSENPSESSQLIEEYGKLKVTSKREFQWLISLGLKPGQALYNAQQWEKRRFEQQSLLRKVMAAAKKSGYKFKMPNGVECTIQYVNGDYCFRYSIAGEEIELFYPILSTAAIEEAKEYGHVSTQKLNSILYNDKAYDATGKIAKAFLQSIVQNINPKVAAVVSIGTENLNGGETVGR